MKLGDVEDEAKAATIIAAVKAVILVIAIGVLVLVQS